MTTLEVLRGMRELLSDPTRWTKFACARDSMGLTVKDDDPSAACWCLIGAAAKVAGRDGGWAKAVNALDRLVQPKPASCWQDEHEHAEVLGLLDRAIVEEAKANE